MITRIIEFFKAFLKKDKVIVLGIETDNLAELGGDYCQDVC
jgi:hypothetical protein